MFVNKGKTFTRGTCLYNRRLGINCRQQRCEAFSQNRMIVNDQNLHVLDT